MKPNFFILLKNSLFHCIFPDYRFKKDEIFKRMKVTTFVQLVSMGTRRYEHLPFSTISP